MCPLNLDFMEMLKDTLYKWCNSHVIAALGPTDKLPAVSVYLLFVLAQCKMYHKGNQEQGHLESMLTFNQGLCHALFSIRKRRCGFSKHSHSHLVSFSSKQSFRDNDRN